MSVSGIFLIHFALFSLEPSNLIQPHHILLSHSLSLIAMEMMNAVILNTPQPVDKTDPTADPDSNQNWLIKGHVEESYCLPKKMKKFEYGGKTQLVAEGDEVDVVALGELRMEGEWSGVV